MKRLPGCFTAFLLLLFTITGNAVDIYVAPNGNDNYAGTKDQPYATVGASLRKARELRRLNDAGIATGIHIILRGGTYYLYEPLFLRPEDTGTANSPTYIEAAVGEQPVLSGGYAITNWQLLKDNIQGLPQNAKGKIWVAEIPYGSSSFRQIWVNHQKAIRARDRNADSMNRILSWNKSDETCWIPTPKTSSLENVNGMEMFIHQWWAVATLRIKNIDTHGDSSQLHFYQPESKIQNEHPWPAPWISRETGNSAFYLTNAIQFLDEPGEWWLDFANRKIYYWPRIGENMYNARVIAPILETLVRIEGTIDNPVSYIFFKGISFQHTGWLRPSQQGHVPHQAGMYMLDAYKLKTPGTIDKRTLENQAWVGRPAAAVEISYASNTGFESCVFTHMASTGLDYGKGTHDSFISGNLFKDIGGTGIMAGIFSDEASEVHLPYNPKDEREICSNLRISNNLVSDATNEDWGCVGIGVGYTRDINIEHNEIAGVSYSGISMGWGWTKTANAMRNNKIAANKIHHYGKQMYDVAAIYTLSAQPGSMIIDNYIDSIYKAPYAHIPSHWFYLYTDEGSSYFTVKNNWCPAEKFLQNANGPGNTWENNGPQVAVAIKEAAGLQAPYQYLSKERAIDSNWPINRDKPVIIELIAAKNEPVNTTVLRQVLDQTGNSTASLYNWENHFVVYGKIKDVLLLRSRISTVFTRAQVKTYDDLFYEFNRSRCDDKTIAKEWDRTILTADLVADPVLQKEYLNYHATQFEKWPEVSNGFCNANFQQLLVFRNGRQLMLVISIPKGESLDKLNPKTTENNPRVDQWNELMKKYQQGIEGTKKGETWVFLSPVDKNTNH